MIIFTVDHIDFELIVRCKNFSDTFNKAKNKNAKILESTSYKISHGTHKIVDPETLALNSLPLNNIHPIFFENKDYSISYNFKSDHIQNPIVYSKTQEVQDKFFHDNKLKLVSGTVNFGNDLGKSDLILRYTLQNEFKEFLFNFEVFPTKLDFRNDYDKIVQDIEKEYPHLVLDFLKKTYSSFKSGVTSNTDLIWWQVFGGLFNEFYNASKFILNKPHNRIIREKRFIKADKITKWTPKLEEDFSEFKYFPNKLYRIDYKTLSTDTNENRFFKHAVKNTFRRFLRIKTYIVQNYKSIISADFLNELNEMEKKLRTISNSSFFNTIGEFRGFKQESLVLQKASGYNVIFKDWIMLNSGLKFLEGMQKIELKNIADLYQIWCFLEIKKVLQKLLGKNQPDEIELAKIQSDDFVSKMDKGAKSKVTYRKSNGDSINLYHEFFYSRNSGNSVKSFTINQEPDIVLNLTRNELKDDYNFTYLFDAKYRLASDDNPNSLDVPPDDAINQMHRYRDAIYYYNQDNKKPEKEIIGAYVLFPGNGNLEKIENANYFQSIDIVNIGAFPLRPNDFKNRVLLENHLKKILELDSETVLRDVSPQKFSVYESPNPEVLIGIVPDEIHAKCFTENEKPFYFTGKDKPNYFGYKNLRYFAPYLQGKGIKDYYEILEYEILSRNMIFTKESTLYNLLHKSDDLSDRLILKLGKKFTIKNIRDYCKISDGSIRHFRYSKLSFIRNPKDEKIEALIVSQKKV